MYAREAELARQFYGAAHWRVIEGLLGQADVADNDGDDVRALALLAQADPLIRAAKLDGSALRARWLQIRGESLFGDARKADEVRTSLEASAVLFKAVEPSNPHYVDALIDLGSLALDQRRDSAAADYYQHAVAVAQGNPQLEGDLLNPYAGLALARENLGDFTGAATAFARSTEIAERTYGRKTQSYWRIASDWAQFRYERGERDAALSAFALLQQSLPVGRATFRNATDAMEAARVLSKYGYCLAIDGQGARAVPLLEQAQVLLMQAAPHPFDIGQLQLYLGTGYEAAGRMADARRAFTAALTEWGERGAPGSKMAGALDRWGHFLLSQSDLSGAATAFTEALQMSAGHATASAVLAKAGLAAIALSRNDAQAALSTSQGAVDMLNHIEGYYDIRIQPYAWGIRAKSLLLVGDRDAGLALASKANDADSAYRMPNVKTF